MEVVWRSPRATARYFGISVRTLSRWRRFLPPESYLVVNGRVRRYNVRGVEAHLRGHAESKAPVECQPRLFDV